MPAGRTQWMGEPPWWDSDESRAKPETNAHPYSKWVYILSHVVPCQILQVVLALWGYESLLNLSKTSDHRFGLVFLMAAFTLKLSTLPNGKDQHNTSSRAKSCVEFFLVDRQSGPHTLWKRTHAMLRVKLPLNSSRKQSGEWHTFALARETFSWLLLLIRKNLASLRIYFNLLVWSLKRQKGGGGSQNE